MIMYHYYKGWGLNTARKTNENQDISRKKYQSINQCLLQLILLFRSLQELVVHQGSPIFHKKRAIPSIENVFVYSDRDGNSDLKSE